MSTTTDKKGAELLKEVANVSGKGGLFRILKPGRSGVIVETLDGKREKSMVGASAQVSVLNDVSIFTSGEQESVPLLEVFQAIRAKNDGPVTMDVKKSSDKDFIEFLNSVLPDFDRSRVYVSDIKKLVNWYNILSNTLPEVFEVADSEEEAAAESEVAELSAKEA